MNGSFVVAVCDPVLGDNGKLYVPEELVQAYKQHIIPLVHLLTPNQFELELLTGVNVTDMPSAQAACQQLHDAGVPSVVCLLTHGVLPCCAWDPPMP